MDYLDMIKRIPPHRTALIENKCACTYGELAARSQQLRDSISSAGSVSLAVIQDSSVYKQLIQFIAYSGTNLIPLLISADTRHLAEDYISELPKKDIPPNACMAVLTSGTTGLPAVWYRSFQSWYSFFGIQNSIFRINSACRMFIHGSMAFTGNLNMCLGLLYAGACIITAAPVHPSAWDQTMEEYQANSIYLIPSKLRLLARFLSCPRPEIRDIISGSQSLGLSDVQKLKQIYPASRCILYYGASELSYVSYLTDSEMNEDSACIGKPFPGVRTEIRDSCIYVHTPFCAEGIPMPYTVGDMGRKDAHGTLYFLGRKGRVYNIHGRKVSAAKVETTLSEIDGIAEAVVTLEKGSVLTAYVVLHGLPGRQKDRLTARSISRALSRSLESWEIPRIYHFPHSLPKSSSGKPLLPPTA